MLGKEGIFKKLGYNIDFPIENKEIRISVLEDLQDISKWTNNDISLPKTVIKGFFDWINKKTQYFEKF